MGEIFLPIGFIGFLLAYNAVMGLVTGVIGAVDGYKKNEPYGHDVVNIVLSLVVLLLFLFIAANLIMWFI